MLKKEACNLASIHLNVNLVKSRMYNDKKTWLPPVPKVAWNHLPSRGVNVLLIFIKLPIGKEKTRKRTKNHLGALPLTKYP